VDQHVVTDRGLVNQIVCQKRTKTYQRRHLTKCLHQQADSSAYNTYIQYCFVPTDLSMKNIQQSF